MTTPLSTDLLVSVDLLDPRGSPIRVPYSVKCSAGETGALPSVALFELSDGRRIEYREFEGRPRVRTFDENDPEPDDGLMSVRTGFSGIEIPRETHWTMHGVTGEPFDADTMLASSEQLDDPCLGERYSEEAIAAMRRRGEDAKAAFARYIVLSEGRHYVECPLPVWRVDPPLGVVALVQGRNFAPLADIRNFAHDRLDGASRLVRETMPEGEELSVRGRIDILLDGFDRRNDPARMAASVVAMLNEVASGDMWPDHAGGMPEDLQEASRLFHEKYLEAKHADGDLLADGTALMQAFVAGGARLPYQLREDWRLLSHRIREIEGIAPTPASAGPAPTA